MTLHLAYQTRLTGADLDQLADELEELADAVRGGRAAALLGTGRLVSEIQQFPSGATWYAWAAVEKPVEIDRDDATAAVDALRAVSDDVTAARIEAAL